MLGGDLEVNPVFELDNRAKRSISLDLTHPDGMAVAHELLAGADVFVTNIRASALERLGLDPGAVTSRYPRLIYAILTGYGLAGKDADHGAYDVAAFWARSGIAASLQAPGSPLPFQRAGMGDHSIAMTGAAMVCAALYARHDTGHGQVVSSSLLRQGVYTIGFDVNVALMWGRSLAVGVRETMGNPTVNNYRTADDRYVWIVGIEADRHWPALARVVGRPAWLQDDRFSTGRSRFVNARELVAALDEIFATKTRAEWIERFATEPDLFWAPVNTLDDLLQDEQFHASGAVVQVPDDSGTSAMVATPGDFGGVPPQPRWRAPELGEHTAQILTELGHDAADVERLIGLGAAFTEPRSP